MRGFDLSLAIPLFGVVILGATSCTEEGRAPAPSAPPIKTAVTPPSTAPVPMRHSVQSERLRQVMAQLSGLRGAVPGSDLPQDAESPAGRDADVAIAIAASLADVLADTAMKIPAAVADRKMTEPERQQFALQARVLYDQSVQLRDAARARKVEGMQKAMDQINTTCFACHSRFRDLAGELEFRKAEGPAAPPVLVGALSERR